MNRKTQRRGTAIYYLKEFCYAGGGDFDEDAASVLDFVYIQSTLPYFYFLEPEWQFFVTKGILRQSGEDWIVSTGQLYQLWLKFLDDYPEFQPLQIS